MKFPGLDTINEMVFENRNKDYGSYHLRKKFHLWLGIGFLSALLFILIITLGYFWYLAEAGDESVYLYDSSMPYLKSVQGSMMTREELESYTGRSENPNENVAAVKKSTGQNFVVTENASPDIFVPPIDMPDYLSESDNTGGLLVDDSTAFGGYPGMGMGSGGMFDRIPEFPDGDATKYVEKNLRYPPLAIKQKIHGIVIVSFVINKTGHVTNVKVERGVNPIIDQEAVKTIQSMPPWKPGMMNGKPINFLFRMPINFVPLS